MALIGDPTADDVRGLVDVIAAPAHLDDFFRRVWTAAWLRALDTSGLLAPPEQTGVWPVHQLSERHAEVGTDLVADWLHEQAARPEMTAR